jgi:hypothetical protein
MSLLDAHSDELIAALEQAPAPLPAKPQPTQRFSAWGLLGAAPKGIAAGAAESAGSTADMGKAIAGNMATNVSGAFGKIPVVNFIASAVQTGADILNPKEGEFTSSVGTSFRNVAADYAPDAQTAHWSETALFDLSRVGSKALTAAALGGNIPGAIVAGAEEGFTAADKLARQGVDVATRTKVGAVTAATNAIGFSLPAAGKTWATTGALAVAGGPASFIAQNAATREILQAADYSQLADQYDPLDPVGLGLSIVLPLGFGALAMRGAKINSKGPMPDGSPPPDGAPPPPAPAWDTPAADLVDAARVNLVREHMDASNPTPTDIASTSAHTAAYEKAMEQQAAGERVDVAGDVPEAAASNASQAVGDRIRAADPAVVIPRDTSLNVADQKIEADLANKVATDFPAAVAEYNSRPDSMGGKVLNTDIARELSPAYMADRTKSAAVHEPSSYFIKQLYAEKLATLPQGDTVLFTSGGTGAGKTTAVDGVPMAKAMLQDAGLVYDTNMNSLESAVKKIQQALDAGQNVRIIHVQRDPIDALVNGALPRALRQAEQFGTGRTVPLREHARTHEGAAKVVQQLAEKYKNDGRVDINILDNTLGKGNAQMSNMDFVRNFNYTDTERRLYDALKQQYDAGAIPESIFRATQGDAGPGVGQVLRADGGNELKLQRDQGPSASQPASAAASQGAVSPLDARLQDIASRNPAALDLEIPAGYDETGKATGTVSLRDFLQNVKDEAAQDAADAGLIETAANCFLSGGA